MTWEELEVGTSAEFSVTVTEAMMARFRDDTGDTNALHSDSRFARKSGFADRVVYGLLTASFYSRLAGVHLPGQHALLHGLNVGFHRPVYVGDTLKVSGTVSYRNEIFRQAEIQCRTVNQYGQLVAAGKIKVGFTDHSRSASQPSSSNSSAGSK